MADKHHVARRKPSPIIVLGLIVVVVIGAAVVLASGSTDEVHPASEPAVSTFAVLEPATAAAMEGISNEAKMRMKFMASNPRLPGPGSSVSEVGVVRRKGGDVTVAAIGGAICAFLAGGIGGCDDAQRVIAGQSFGAEPAPCGQFRVLGVVPDGVTSIAIDIGDDGDIDSTLPVTSNVYVGTVDPVLITAQGRDESGATRFTLEMPLSYYASTKRTGGGLESNC